MKILLINNNTRHLADLKKSLSGHDVEIRKYHPGVDFSCEDKDLIILSGGGGEGLEIHDEHRPGHLWYQEQMNFILACKKPIIGICMGFEIICRAFGSEVKQMPKGLDNTAKLRLTGKGREFFQKQAIEQFESHDWCVKEAPDDFEVLAHSATGVEIVKHKQRPIIATQFHPEKAGTINLGQLINQTV